MNRIGLLASLLLVLLVSPSCSWARPDVWERSEHQREHRGGREHREGRERKLDLEFVEAREILRSEGGALRVWSEDVEALRNTHVAVAELDLEQDGLLVPQYADAEKIAYVLEGTGRMGAVIPFEGEFRRHSIRRVQPGDVIAIPKGVVYWWYNDGNERHRVFCASDTSRGANPGRFHQFGLAGAKQSRFGGVLHGFSKDALATAWGVDEQTVQSLLESQNEAGIIKTGERIRFPEAGRVEDDQRSTDHSEELTYNIDQQQADLHVRDGGSVKVVNSQRLPVLQAVGFGAMKVALEEEAVYAPSFYGNAHQIIYITRGNGRIQVASDDGETVFDKEVQEGSVFVIPQFFPSIKIAGKGGLEWINLLTSDRPSPSFLAGRNSVYRAIPRQVVAAAFNIDDETLSQLRRSGRDEEVIFPRRSREGRHQQQAHGHRGRGDRGVAEKVEGWVYGHVAQGKNLFEEASERLLFGEE